MKSIFKYKFLQYLSAKQQNSGFSLIKLLIIIIILSIVGIGVTIFLPSAISCGSKATSAEAKNTIGAINRGQQAYYYEKNKFVKTLEELKIGISRQSKNYNYSIQTKENIAYIYGTARNNNLKSFAGIVWAKNDKKNTITLICRSTIPNTQQIPATIVSKSQIVCAPNTEETS